MVAPDINGTLKKDEDKDDDEVKNGDGHDAGNPDSDKYDADSEKDSRSDDSDSTGGVPLTPHIAAQEPVEATHFTSGDEPATLTPLTLGPACKYPTFSTPASSHLATRRRLVPYTATWPHVSLRSLSWPPASPASVDRLLASPAVERLLASPTKSDVVEDIPTESQEVQEVQDKEPATKDEAPASSSPTNKFIASRTKRLPREPKRPRHVRFAAPPSEGRPDKIKSSMEDKPDEKSQEIQKRSSPNSPPPTPDPPPPTPNPPPPTRPPPQPPPNGIRLPRCWRWSRAHPMTYLWFASLHFRRDPWRAPFTLRSALFLLCVYLALKPFRFTYRVLRTVCWKCAEVVALLAGVVEGIRLGLVSVEQGAEVWYEDLRSSLCVALTSQNSDE